MTAFSMFTDKELDTMETAFYNEGLTYLIDEICEERRNRESFLPIMRHGESRKVESKVSDANSN